MTGIIPENEYTDIVNYLYNSKDATTLRILLRSEASRVKEEQLQAGAVEGPEAGGASAGSLSRGQHPRRAGTRRQLFENRKLGGERQLPPSMREGSLARSRQERFMAVKDNFDLPFDVFMKCVLDFQLNAHENYLAGFKHIFRHYDDDGDGVLTSEQFRQCYIRLRSQGDGADASISRVSLAGADDHDTRKSGAASTLWSQQDENAFLEILSVVDPAETDRVTFSAAAACLNRISKSTYTTSISSEGSKRLNSMKYAATIS